MRLAATGTIALVLTTMLSACAPPRLDPEQTAERAVTGATLGAALGSGLGATVAINPLLGAWIGADTGATLGGAIGIITTPPLPDYKPIAVPTAAVIPNYYDSWPPGYGAPPSNPETTSPHPG